MESKMANGFIKVQRLNEEQKAVIVKAVFERVKVKEYARKFMFALLALSLPIAVSAAASASSFPVDAKWTVVLINLVVTSCFVVSVYFLYNLLSHLFGYIRIKNIAKAIGCNPEDFSNHDVLIHILKPMLDQGKWQTEVGEQFKA